MNETKTVEERMENREILRGTDGPIHTLSRLAAELRLKSVNCALESWEEADTDHVPMAEERRQIQSLKIERKALNDRLEELQEEEAA